MRVMFFAALAAVLLACQQPSAPEAGETVDQTVPSSAVGNDHAPSESEEHHGC